MAVAVNNGLNIRPKLINPAVNESLEIRLGRNRGGGHAVVRKFHDIAGFDQFWRSRARKQKTAGIVGVASANMSKSVHDPLGRQNAIGGHKVFNQRIEIGHADPPWKRTSSKMLGFYSEFEQRPKQLPGRIFHL